MFKDNLRFLNSVFKDGRIRLTPKNKKFMSSGSILRPLVATNGLMFPYTPTITWSIAPQYSTQATTHANQDYRSFVNVPAITIQIAGKFTAQNTDDALYMLACLHFMRTVTKMHFGNPKDPALGLPPPVLLLNGYGSYIFNNLPVIIGSFNMTMPDNIDYMSVKTPDGKVNQLPVISEMGISCIVQTTPQFQRTFDWDKFAAGTLLTQSNSVSGLPGGWF